MDEKCDNLLNDILDEVKHAFAKTKSAYLKDGNTGAYIHHLAELTNILMSVKNGLALSNQPIFASVPDFSKEELT